MYHVWKYRKLWCQSINSWGWRINRRRRLYEGQLFWYWSSEKERQKEVVVKHYQMDWTTWNLAMSICFSYIKLIDGAHNLYHFSDYTVEENHAFNNISPLYVLATLNKHTKVFATWCGRFSLHRNSWMSNWATHGNTAIIHILCSITT